jgi:hypothetical protein
MTQAMTEKPVGLCLDCDYPLQGLQTTRCPECGREFDPNDPCTMNMGRKIGDMTWWWLGPISSKLYALTLVAAVVTLWFARLPNNIFQPMPIACIIWITIGAVWFVWPVLRYVVAVQKRWPRFKFKTGLVQWLVMPLIIVLMIVAIRYRVPLRLTFWASRPSMESLAKQVIEKPETAPNEEWAGAYNAKKIRRTRHGMQFTVEDANVNYRAGFIYMPGVDPSRGKDWPSRRYVGDGWWIWREEG